MRDSHKEIRSKYYLALNGNISITDADGLNINVPVYDNIPNNATYPFIHFDSFSLADTSVKDQYLQDVRMTLIVYTRYDSSYGGSTDSDNITNSILQLLIVDPASYFTTTNFIAITTRLESRESQKVVTDNYKFYLSAITISHLIEQIN